jgi:hypothetical protein
VVAARRAGGHWRVVAARRAGGHWREATESSTCREGRAEFHGCGLTELPSRGLLHALWPPLQELLRIYANDGGIYRHRWSDQSTFPFVLAAFSAKIRNFGGIHTSHVMTEIFKERWGDTSVCNIG